MPPFLKPFCLYTISQSFIFVQMRKFLKAAFKISLWEIFIIVAFGALKYILISYELADKISRPFVWICLGAGLLFIIAWGIIGTFLNKYESFEKWEAEAKSSQRGRFIIGFVKLGQLIPTALGCFLFIYVIAPSTLNVFIAFIVGIVLRNSIQFFQLRKKRTVPEAN